MRYYFTFNLRTKEVHEGELWKIEDEDKRGKAYADNDHAVRYLDTPSGKRVEIGDSFRHYSTMKEEHWNRLVKIIRDDELDKSGMEIFTRGFLERDLPEHYEGTFISAIKEGILKEA